MAVSNSVTVHTAREFSLRGEAQDVSHKTEGSAAVEREAIVLIETLTFLDRGSTRKVSSVTVTFLSAVGVSPGDTITLPGGQPKAVLKVTSSFAPYLYLNPVTESYSRGFLTEALLA